MLDLAAWCAKARSIVSATEAISARYICSGNFVRQQHEETLSFRADGSKLGFPRHVLSWSIPPEKLSITHIYPRG